MSLSGQNLPAPESPSAPVAASQVTLAETCDVESAQQYPNTGNVPTSPCAEDIARLGSMYKSSPTRVLPDGPLAPKLASDNQLIHLRHVSGSWDPQVLSFEDYMKIENELATMSFAQRSRKFVLVPETDPDVQTVIGNYGAALGTPLELRQKGYASALIAGLSHLLKSKEPEQYRFFCLLSKSDKFYKTATQSGNGVMAVLRRGDNLLADINTPNVIISSKGANAGLSEVIEGAQAMADELYAGSNFALTPINYSDIDAVVKEDAALMVMDCQDLALKTGLPVASFVPLVDAFQHQARRCALRFQFRYDSDKEVHSKFAQLGNQIGNPGTKDWAFVTWRIPDNYCPQDKIQLHITRLRYSNTKQLRILLQSVLDAAESWGIDDGVRWITSERSAADLDELGIPYDGLIGNHYFPISRLSLCGEKDNVPHVLFAAEP